MHKVAILLAPATVASCVNFSSSLLWNALLAPFVLHERLSRTHGLGILLLSGGGTAVTWASCHSDPTYDWQQLALLPHRPQALRRAGPLHSRFQELHMLCLYLRCGAPSSAA